MESNFLLKGKRETTTDSSHLMLKVLCVTVTPDMWTAERRAVSQL